MLSKIIDESKVQGVLTGEYVVQEEDLEVKDLNLTEDEFEAFKDLGSLFPKMHCCRWHQTLRRVGNIFFISCLHRQ